MSAPSHNAIWPMQHATAVSVRFWLYALAMAGGLDSLPYNWDDFNWRLVHRVKA